MTPPSDNVRACNCHIKSTNNDFCSSPMYTELSNITLTSSTPRVNNGRTVKSVQARHLFRDSVRFHQRIPTLLRRYICVQRNSVQNKSGGETPRKHRGNTGKHRGNTGETPGGNTGETRGNTGETPGETRGNTGKHRGNTGKHRGNTGKHGETPGKS